MQDRRSGFRAGRPGRCGRSGVKKGAPPAWPAVGRRAKREDLPTAASPGDPPAKARPARGPAGIRPVYGILAVHRPVAVPRFERASRHLPGAWGAVVVPLLYLAMHCLQALALAFVRPLGPSALAPSRSHPASGLQGTAGAAIQALGAVAVAVGDPGLQGAASAWAGLAAGGWPDWIS